MSQANSANTVTPLLSGRRLVLQALAALALAPQTAWSFSLFGTTAMNSPETDIFKWDVDFCGYGIDINPRANGLIETLADNKFNWLRDVQGNTVALFYTGFGAAWGSGSSPMGGPPRDGARLPLSLRMSYYDYVEDRFYQLDATLPLKRIHELFVQQTMDKSEEQLDARFSTLRIGVGPQGYIMIWAVGLAAGDQVELASYRAQIIQGLTMEAYLSNITRGFRLNPDRFAELAAWRFKPDDIARIKAGWHADPMYYMRTIRVKYPWRYRLTGQARTMVELESYEGNAEAQSVGAWEMNRYQISNTMRTVPETAKFWFLDPTGQRHHLWISFYLRERAVSEADLSEMRTAFEHIFPKRTLEDNDYLPSDQDMATVEVHASEDFKTFTATLTRGDVRLPLPVGRTQYFPLKPNAYWPGTDGPKPEMLKLFKEGPSTS